MKDRPNTGVHSGEIDQELSENSTLRFKAPGPEECKIEEVDEIEEHYKIEDEVKGERGARFARIREI